MMRAAEVIVINYAGQGERAGTRILKCKSRDFELNYCYSPFVAIASIWRLYSDAMDYFILIVVAT